MELRSSYFNANMNIECKDILTPHLIEMVIELSSNAIFFMNTEMDGTVTAKTAKAIADILKNHKYKFMPFHLVVEGFNRGSMGELGGTTRFTVRNVCVWLNAMYEKLVTLNAEKKTREDAERRKSMEKDFLQVQKVSSLYGAASRRKLEWCYAGLVPNEQYDLLSLDKIVEAMKNGYDVRELMPSMIL